VIVVSDSSPLISLAKIEAFQLLDQLYGQLTISAEVFREVVVSGAGLPGAAETSGSPWITVKRINRANDLTDAQGRFGLGLGELSTMILAKEIGADLVLLDDRGARKLAQKDGLRVQGTIAVLEACYRKGYLIDLRGEYLKLLNRGVFLRREVLNGSLESFRLAPI
jgi:predicted nucleic acid-binding protein